MTTTQATLLFAHGGSFCKEVWNPIIRRLKKSSLLQGVATEYVTFDFPYHGSKHDNSIPAQLNLSVPNVPRVTHPALEMAQEGPREVYRQTQQIHQRHDARYDNNSTAKQKTPLIGIGHSMGAVALWLTEVAHPGTFDALILFEPGIGLNRPHNMPITSFLVTMALRRESTWPSLAAAHAHFHQLENFSRWDREVLAGYLAGALIQSPTDGNVSLACHPHVEAAIYCHKSVLLSEDELTRPRCESITFHYGTRTNVFLLDEFFKPLVTQLPHLYKLGEPMLGLSHLMTLEDPELSTTRILDSLAQLSAFQNAAQASTSSSRL